MGDHAPIVDRLLTAREARASGHDEAAEHIITGLYAEYGREAVHAVAIALPTMRPGGETR